MEAELDAALPSLVPQEARKTLQKILEVLFSCANMARRKNKMKVNYFVIIADGLDPDADDTYNAFHEAGCDDATVAWREGAFTLYFHREAARFDEALMSAYRDVTKAGATVTRFEPDTFVTLTDIAERSGLTASTIADLRRSQEGVDFPPPSIRVTTDEPLWDWAAVALWLQRRQLVDRSVAIEARVLWEANTTLLLQSMQGTDFEQAFAGLQAAAV